MTATITVGELKKKSGSTFQLVDVRSSSEFSVGHIPGATNIPMEQIEARLDDFSRDRPIVLICKSGQRAHMTAGFLEPCQRQIAVLEGGTQAWIRAGLPVIASVKTRWSLERQVRLGAGLLVLTGCVLAVAVNPLWVFFSGFIGLGLSFAGLTDLCPMAMLLAKMPWNAASHCKMEPRQQGDLAFSSAELRVPTSHSGGAGDKMVL